MRGFLFGRFCACENFIELAIVPRHADDAASVASASRQALDVQRSQRAAADRRRDQGAGAPVGA
jgi:hypothetical protein